MLSEEGILVHAQQCFPKLAEREDSPTQQRYRLHPTPSKPESLAATLESSPPPPPDLLQKLPRVILMIS